MPRMLDCELTGGGDGDFFVIEIFIAEVTFGGTNEPR